MRVRADDEISAGEMAAFGHHLMADAVAHVVERRTICVRKTAHGNVDVRRFGCRRRRIMIEHERRARCIRQLRHAELAQLLEGVARARVVQHREVDSRDDHFACANGAIGMRGEDLFGERITQGELR
jgi:hypothetical protein